MEDSNRRVFLKSSAVSAAALGTASAVRAASANEKVVVATIGCGGQGNAHIGSLGSLKNVEIAYVCDPDMNRLSKAVKKAGGRTKPTSDLRRILDDKTVDAVTIATPDHWHAAAALLAIEAGKHVYVEKPCSHNVREGRLLLDAARRNRKVVAHGTQSRSSVGIRHAIELLHDGIIGDVLVAKAWNIQKRRNIGHAKPGSPPKDLDYDLWVGPAKWLPYQSNRLHYNWHWWRNFGCGGIGNDGIHDLDYARWGLGVSTHPSRVSGMGGKFYFDDDQQFPDTQQIMFEFPADDKVGKKRMLIFEQRLWSVTYPFNVDSGAEFYGTNGEMFLSKRGKIRVVGPGNRTKEITLRGKISPSVAGNQQNWIDCIRKGGRPNADIEIGHKTATCCHLGNIVAQLGRSFEFDADKEQIVDDEQANQLLSRQYRTDGHWAIPKT